MRHFDEDIFYDFAANRLDEQEASEIRSHLSNCEECRDAFERIAAFSRSLSFTPAYSEHFTHELMQKVNLESAPLRTQTLPSSAERVSLLEVLRYWMLPALQIGAAVALLLIQTRQSTSMDLNSALLSGLTTESATEDLSSGISDLSLALGVNTDGSSS